MQTDPRYLSAAYRTAIALTAEVLRSLRIPDVTQIQLKSGPLLMLEAVTAKQVRYLVPFDLDASMPFHVRLLAVHRVRAKATVIRVTPDGRSRRGINQLVFWGAAGGPQARWSRGQILDEGDTPLPWLASAPLAPPMWRMSDGELWQPLQVL